MEISLTRMAMSCNAEANSHGASPISIDYSHIVLNIAIWPGDRIRRPEHSTVEHGSCEESVQFSVGRTLH